LTVVVPKGATAGEPEWTYAPCLREDILVEREYIDKHTEETIGGATGGAGAGAGEGREGEVSVFPKRAASSPSKACSRARKSMVGSSPVPVTV
jgi:hypothetical protein